MNIQDNPCYNCKKRTSTCHSSCEDYLTWKKEYDEVMKKAKFKRRVWIPY